MIVGLSPWGGHGLLQTHVSLAPAAPHSRFQRFPQNPISIMKKFPLPWAAIFVLGMSTRMPIKWSRCRHWSSTSIVKASLFATQRTFNLYGMPDSLSIGPGHCYKIMGKELFGDFFFYVWGIFFWIPVWEGFPFIFLYFALDCPWFFRAFSISFLC